jgi:tyrosine-protein phosphatase YwqE
LASEYKIIVHSSKKERVAQHKQKQLLKRLEHNPQYHTLQKRYHFQLQSRASNAYYIVVLEPLPTYRIAKQLLKLVHTIEAGAFINKIKTDPLQKSEPTAELKHTLTIKNNTPPPKETPVILPPKKEKKLTPKEPIHHPRSTEKSSKKSSFFILTLLLATAIGVWLLLKYFKRAPDAIDCSAHLRNALQADIKPTLLVDTNAPIIPGVEHGPKDVHTALNLILKLEELGFKKLIVTPKTAMTMPNKKFIDEGFHILEHALKESESSVSVSLAVEYELNEVLLELLKETDEIITFNHNYLLCNMPYTHKPALLMRILDTIKTMGYIPVLAHIERYEFLNTLDDYTELKSSGVMFQFNTTALLTHEDREKITLLTTNHLIDFLSSNAVSTTHLENLHKVMLTDAYQNLFKQNIILNNYLLS